MRVLIMYVYKQTESMLWTVGFYDTDGKWIPESDWNDPAKAAERVHWLNGAKRNKSNWDGLFPHYRKKGK